MKSGLRIAIADDESRMRDNLRETLIQFGHEVVVAVANGRELVDACRANQPDLIITDIKMPEMDGLDAAAAIYQENVVPIILVSGWHDAELIERVQRNHVLAYLIKPVREADLCTAIAVAMARFEEFQALRKEAQDLRQALDERKAIERAKGILMKRGGLGEADAFRRLQRLASEKRRKLIDIAQMIVTAEEALTMGEPDEGKTPPTGA